VAQANSYIGRLCLKIVSSDSNSKVRWSKMMAANRPFALMLVAMALF
jgi:hypothetical protein